MVQIGAGIQNTPNQPLQNFLETYPANPGELVGMPMGPQVEKALGLAWEVGSIGVSEFDVLNTFGEGENLALPMTQLGTDVGKGFYSAAGLLSDLIPQPTTGNNNTDGSLLNLTTVQLFTTPSTSTQNSSIGK